MSWTFNGVRIYVQQADEKDTNMIARLQPISGGTTLHHFGYEDEIMAISCKVVTDADKDALKALAKTSSAYAFVSPEGSLGSYYVNEFSASRTASTNITYFDRPGLDCDTPEYDVTMTLYKA